MIRKIAETALYNDKKHIINNLNSMDELEWDSPTGLLKELKDSIQRDLIHANGNSVLYPSLPVFDCGYCGTRMNVSGRPEVEHIAHKAKYRMFSYHPTNLVYVCSNCNGSSKKGQRNVVSNFDERIKIDFSKDNVYDQIQNLYSTLKFDIIHPKLDDPDDHIEWVDEEKTIIKNGKTPKGVMSIEMFELSSYSMISQRKKDYEEERQYLEDPDKYIEMLKYSTSY